eukprot:COSAG04_NODE_8891_length_920_cov_1.512789_2_plen_245_part_01
MAAVFFEAEHVDNNYANKSMPVGGPGSGSGPDDPQYFDCHERTSGLYPAYLATALCVVLQPLYVSLDPEYGIKCMRGKSWEEKNAEVEAKMRAEVIEKEAGVPLEEQAGALRAWAEQTDGSGACCIPAAEVIGLARAAAMDFKALCELLGVTETESEEPVREGSAVRHDGRVGTATEPDSENEIKIEWADDGSKSRYIKVDEVHHLRIDLKPGVGREDFVAACTQDPERTAKMHAWLLLTTTLEL